MTIAITQPPRVDAAELAELMATMNSMAARLAETHAHLQQQVAALKAELAEANEQLRRSRSLAALGEMAAGIAHELRNPLGCISLYAQMLTEDLAHEPRLMDTARRMSGAVKRMDSVVNDVLAFARDMRIQPTETTAAEIVDRALADCEGILAGEGIRISRDRVQESGLRLKVDGGLISSVLSNLIRNGAEAMIESATPNRAITIIAGREIRRCPDGRRAMRVVLSVVDCGPGVPAALRSQIFNPFFTTRAGGTGLGLAIVHRIVDAHGGHMSVGEGEGCGARFDVCLPARAGSERISRRDEESGASLAKAVSRRLAREHAA